MRSYRSSQYTLSRREQKRSPKMTPTMWPYFSVAMNCFFLILFLLLLRDDYLKPQQSQATIPMQPEPLWESPPNPNPPKLKVAGPTHRLNYLQWVQLLGKEAQIMANRRPKKLNIMIGDSITLWFPNELLPNDRAWLNQGISGETSEGLLERLYLIDQTKPEAIFIMIGINDLTKGVSPKIVLSNYRQIIRYLKTVHPTTKIVVQSILPHSGSKSTWSERDRLRKIPNSKIREINQQLQEIATEEKVQYLDLYQLYSDSNGFMRTELTSDGLHLGPQGYLIWSSAIRVYQQLHIK